MCHRRRRCPLRRAATRRSSEPPLVMKNGLGGFTPDGREYVVVLEGERETPLPWSNVLANPTVGTIVSSSGSQFTWAGNSRENRLTPFANDPLTDPTSEAFYIRDDESGAVWSATPAPLPRRPDGGKWVVRHAAGVTRYQHAVAGMRQELDGLRGAGGSGEARRADAHQRQQPAAAPQRVRLCGVVPGSAAQRRTPFRRHRARRGQRCAVRQQPLQHGARRGGRVPAGHRARRVIYRRSHRIRRAQSHARGAGGALPRAARFANGRRPRPVRRAARRARDRAG